MKNLELTSDDWSQGYQKFTQNEGAVQTSLQPTVQLNLKFEPRGWHYLIEQLADLKKAGLLSIDNNAELGILTIISKLGKTSDYIAVINDYLKHLRTEFAFFKKQLSQTGESIEHFHDKVTTNGLVIRIPSPKLYDQFMAKLDKKQLVSLVYENQLEPSSENDEHLELTPFDMVPRPKGSRGRKK
ncbi:hypothetical protein [Legionella jordanis]|uniref:Uncharacterized protein n=1 Tax=Legionella jordanis TaxID=456 RepID=A0A0W0VBK3_9GAMM|nr:hypothetical protein [Legionella jordanis]KTD17495.1 hypothetical protein Ljor_1801 [Legionella jordanis]RMX05166.1 hypothetical protein EAW55_00420 [Legionella jordanis]RMX17422.1 hypothetical protein EAS68_11050 [Legionella jordanis]VEH13464.1 Uncharacterised protein [Legionella jordanis]HAT8714383.1 hypothetical protein [Legionella jordanis]